MSWVVEKSCFEIKKFEINDPLQRRILQGYYLSMLVSGHT